MNNLSTKKEEIYKIVKYQTKLAEATTLDKKNLYKYKLNKHATDLVSRGANKRAVLTMAGGNPLEEALAEQRDATILKINEIKDACGKTSKIDEMTKTINEGVSEIDSKHKEVIEKFNNFAMNTNDSFNKVQTAISGFACNDCDPAILTKFTELVANMEKADAVVSGISSKFSSNSTKGLTPVEQNTATHATKDPMTGTVKQMAQQIDENIAKPE
jgi:hypothetical protein